MAVCDPIFHSLSLLLGQDQCGDRVLRSCLQKGPATTPADYARSGQPHVGIVRVGEKGLLRWATSRVEKNRHARVKTRVLKTLACQGASLRQRGSAL